MRFIEYRASLNERFLNAIGSSQLKDEHVDSVWELLQKSYAPIGGIKGSGFSSKKDMIDNIPFWKMVKKNGKIIAVQMYKDNEGRKRVAVGTDGSQAAKEQLREIYKADFQRSYFEISGPSLSFAVRTVGEDFIVKYQKSKEEAEDILREPLREPDDNEMEQKFPKLKRFMYSRSFGGSWKTKIMIGTTGKKIISTD